MLHSKPTFHLSQCPFIQMIYTDITLLPIYVNTDLARLHSMIFTSPSVPVSYETLDRVGCENKSSVSPP
jgi:hypothetical protein